jgi:phosphatidylglycerol:prolipoprotein diacylglycerol transferase
MRETQALPFPNFDPVLIHLGPFGIRWYALAYIFGIMAGWGYGHYLATRPRLWTPRTAPLTKLQIDDLMLWVTLGVIVGGRLGSVLFYGLDNYIHHPLEIFMVWTGGMSFHGGMTGVVVAIIAYVVANGYGERDKSRPVNWRAAWRPLFDRALGIGDLVAPCVPFGLFFGRLANFINGELWGRTTHVPWGIVFCNQHIQDAFGGCPAGHEPRHPSQLYEAGLEGIVLFLILRLATHRFHLLPRRGAVTGLFALCYGLFRIMLETVRNPDLNMPNYPFGLTMGMMLSTPMVLAGLALLWYARRPLDGDAEAEAAPDAPAA